MDHSWTRAASDFLIGISYFAISLTLYLIGRRIKVRFSAIIFLLGLFIGSCGLTHFLEIWDLGNGEFWFAGGAKVFTAIASVSIAIYLVKLRPWIFEVAKTAKDVEAQALHLAELNQTLEKRVEDRTRELKLAENKFRNTFQKATVGMAHVGLDGKWLMVNPRLCEITGFSQEELLSKSFADITYPDDIEKDWDQARDLREGKISSYEMEKRYFRKDGTIIWVKLSVAMSRDISGSPDYYISCVTDISAEKAARELAELEKAKIVNLFEQVPTPIAIYEGPEHRITLANPEYRRQTGKEDVIGKTYAETFVFAQQQGITQLLTQVYESGEPWTASEYPIRIDFPEGAHSERFINATLQPFRGLNGEVEGLINLSYDVTEHVRARQRLEESEERFRTLFEQSPLSIEIHSPDGGLVQTNEAWRKLWSIPEDQVPEVHRTYNVLKDRSLEKKGILKYIEQGFTGVFAKTPAVFYDPVEIGVPGRTRWIETYISPIKNNDGTLREVAIVHEDITDRREAEEAIRAAKDAAEAASEAKTQFLANMSHEIRTPLGAMLGFTQLMLEDEQASEIQRNSLRTIVRNGDQLYRIINELLDISKVEANKFEVEKSKFDLEEVIRDVTSLLSVKAEQKGIEFNVSSEGPLPDTVHTDQMRFKQILTNIIGNAIKFTEKGKVDVVFKLRDHEVHDGSWYLECRVQDTGVGIPADKIGKLFRPFAQADETTTRKFGGTGLGLYLSKKFAEALGGDIRLLGCEESKGCTFLIAIDIGRLERRPLLNFKSVIGEHVVKGAFRKASLDRLHDVRVLVVDDSADNLELTRRFLTASGAYVETVLGAAKALDRLLHAEFDVIVMDIQMPEIDGYEAVGRLRQMGYEKPVIALTAHAMKGERERCLKAGFDGYLVKPINRPALVKEIKSQSERSSN